MSMDAGRRTARDAVEPLLSALAPERMRPGKISRRLA